MHSYFAIASAAALFNPKAKQFIEGRKSTFSILESNRSESENRYWFHCASLGEFEQARPLIEALKKRDKNAFFAVSFFSPSGYEIRKNYPLADVVFYLPKDTKNNAEKLISLLRPTQVFWIKYEFWLHILEALNAHKIPTFLVCANFRENQVFFKSYGAFFRKQLAFFSAIFVQNPQSEKRLQNIGFSSITAGDTRFDRVAEIASNARQIPEIEAFAQGKKLFIAGSTWNADVKVLASALDDTFFAVYKLVIVPHDVSEKAVAFIVSSFSRSCAKFSDGKKGNINAEILILDTTGLLASAYRYGTLAYIGGGFGASVHNVLEAAVYGLPAIFGTNCQKSQEALDLIEKKAAKSVRNPRELKAAITFFENSKTAAAIAKNYVAENMGGTERVLGGI